MDRLIQFAEIAINRSFGSRALAEEVFRTPGRTAGPPVVAVSFLHPDLSLQTVKPGPATHLMLPGSRSKTFP